jgi:uncharacterized repeat protein (TIGR02543 family)
MDQDRNLTANFALREVDKFLLSISVTPLSGGTVMGSGEYTDDSNATIFALPNPGYSFAGWSGDSVLDTNASTTTVHMTEDRNISATFAIHSYDLNISAGVGGDIEGNGTFNYGTHAQILAIPKTGYSFDKWTGNGIANPLDSNTTIHMSGDRNIAASFKLNSYNLALSFNEGGSVQGSNLYSYGTDANISATPSTGYSFTGWTGEGIADHNATSTTVSMTQARTVSAAFSLNSYVLPFRLAMGDQSKEMVPLLTAHRHPSPPLQKPVILLPGGLGREWPTTMPLPPPLS